MKRIPISCVRQFPLETIDCCYACGEIKKQQFRIQCVRWTEFVGVLDRLLAKNLTLRTLKSHTICGNRP
jgi:hypothetical protein